jgi:hypothetical protein
MLIRHDAVSSNELHLLGGLRAGTHQDGHLILYPTTDGKVLACKSVRDTRAYYQTFRKIGTDLIGHERHTTIAGKQPDSLWTQFYSGKRRQFEVADHWSGIAHTSHKAGNHDLATLAKHIAFTFRVSELRLRDCSREYGWQNEHAVVGKIRPNGRFWHIKSFDLDMALHSLLTDMGTARDYLGHFTSRYILREKQPCDSMAKLYERAKKNKLQVSEAGSAALIGKILQICDPTSAEGWMARLSEFRNIIMHRAPIGSIASEHYLTAKTLFGGEGQVFQIFFGIPRDPIAAANTDFVDALAHFLELFRRLREFGYLVADASGVEPTILQITDKDIVARPVTG